MLQVLSARTYRHLLVAQIIALVGTGLLTVALAAAVLAALTSAGLRL